MPAGKVWRERADIQVNLNISRSVTMHTETVQPLSAQLAQPLSESIRQDNAGQFALMLSLLHEALVQPQFAPSQYGQFNVPGVPMPAPPQRSFNLEMQLNLALAADSPAQANLLRSVLAERTDLMVAALLPAVPGGLDGGEAGQPLRRSGDALMAQLDHARQHGLGRPPVDSAIASQPASMLAL